MSPLLYFFEELNLTITTSKISKMTSQQYGVYTDMILRKTIADTLTNLDIGSVFVTNGKEIDNLNQTLSTNKPLGRLMKSIIVFDLEPLGTVDWQRSAKLCETLNIPTLGVIPSSYLTKQHIDIDDSLSDFIFVPFTEDELLLRAKKLVASTKNISDQDVIVQDQLVISPHSYEVTLKGRRVHLRFKEYELLLLLASNPGRVYDRETLLNHIWGYDYFGGTRTVDVHIRRLRSKIEQPDTQFIETIWNVGYRFRPVHEG